MKTTFKKLNQRPLKISYTKPKKGEPRAFFQYNGQNIYLDTILRVKDSPWINATDFPDCVHGIAQDRAYGNYIELCPDGEHANIYDRLQETPDDNAAKTCLETFFKNKIIEKVFRDISLPEEDIANTIIRITVPVYFCVEEIRTSLFCGTMETNVVRNKDNNVRRLLYHFAYIEDKKGKPDPDIHLEKL